MVSMISNSVRDFYKWFTPRLKLGWLMGSHNFDNSNEFFSNKLLGEGLHNYTGIRLFNIAEQPVSFSLESSINLGREFFQVAKNTKK